jgi:hypothetical protein
MHQNINFLYDGNAIEIVNEFTYLGLNFSRTGSFTNAKKVLINKAYKAMYEVLNITGLASQFYQKDRIEI